MRAAVCSVLGKFELLVKRYPAWGSPSFPHNYKPPGKVSNYIHSLEVGAMVNFKHIAFNIKKQYPFTVGNLSIARFQLNMDIPEVSAQRYHIQSLS